MPPLYSCCGCDRPDLVQQLLALLLGWRVWGDVAAPCVVPEASEGGGGERGDDR